ncbi:MAG: ABC transporter substrate-binding protein [Bacteroidales bacterium]|nr:ABC transporter substrate-binding protein [Bacteroidales bacterium]
MKRIINITLVICLVFELVSCKKQVNEPNIGADNVYITPNAEIKNDNRRIASVSPQVTEILCELGCMDRLVSRTDFCKYPPSVEKIQSVGGINDANLELIISLHPDIVITSSIFTKKMVKVLEDAGLTVLSFREGSKIEDMYKVMTTLGKVVNKEKTADSLIHECKVRLEKVSSRCDSIIKAKNMDKPKVYYVVGYGSSGDFSAGADTYVNEIFNLAGGDNIAKNAKNWSFNKEELFKNQPEYIFVRSYDVDNFKTMHPYSELQAVKNGNVFGIDDLDNQTPRSIDAIEFIFKTIYKL